MKVSAYFHARLFTKNNDDYIVLTPADAKDRSLLRKLFNAKSERESRRCEESLLNCLIDLPYKSKSFSQLGAIFKVITSIFESMENRRPCEEEKYNLYLDLLEEYADRVPSRIHPGRIRCVHLSESNTFEASHFLEAIIVHLVSMCDINIDIQADVRQVLWEWETWRGSQGLDPCDYYDKACTLPLSETDFRKRNIVSAASGISDKLQLHHIVSRGSDTAAIECVWNWVMLTDDEHRELHQYGEKYFLRKYPHLNGRFTRANKNAGKKIGVLSE